MEQRDRPEVSLREIIEETIGNLGRLEAEARAVKRRLCEHLELTGSADLDRKIPRMLRE